MKRTIMLAMLLAVAITTAFAQKTGPGSNTVEKILPVSSFDQLTIDGNFKLTLIESNEPYIYIKGSEEFIKAFKTYHLDNKLLVSSLYKRNPGDNNQVIIPVKGLKELTVRKKAFIDVMRMTMPDDMVVVLDAECTIRVNKKNMHKIEANDNLTLEVLNTIK